MMLNKILVLGSFMVLLSACGADQFKSMVKGATEGSSSTPETPVTPPEPLDLFKIDYRWDGQHADADRWTEFIADSVEAEGIVDLPAPTDIKDFCPNYANLGRNDRLLFWIYLFSSMTEKESGFDPNTTYTEAFEDANGNNVVSRGLLQLSIESALGYECPLENAQALHNAQLNLHCGARILARWLKTDKVISAYSGSWRGGARYWSVLRTPTVTTIKGWTKATSICK